MQSEETWMELHALHRHGWSIADLAREFGLNWRTAKKYATAGEPPGYRPRARPAELTAAQLAHVERRLTACPDLRATVLLRELTEGYGYTGSYGSLRRRVVILRPATAAEPVLRFETDPGEQTQGDWADLGSWPLGDGTAELFAFVAILGCSRMVRSGHDQQDRPTTLRSIVRCVDDLGGATADFLHDRDTALMAGSARTARRSTRPSGSTSRPCSARARAPAGRTGPDEGQGRAGHPRGEARLPRLAHGAGDPEHPTLAWYDAQARAWATGVQARRRHGTTGRVVGEAWEAERRSSCPSAAGWSRGWRARTPSCPCRRPDRTADARAAGETVEVRPLAVYAELAR